MLKRAVTYGKKMKSALGEKLRKTEKGMESR